MARSPEASSQANYDAALFWSFDSCCRLLLHFSPRTATRARFGAQLPIPVEPRVTGAKVVVTEFEYL
jgi:hypothetical protein